MTAAIGRLFDTLQSKIANGGRDTNCKFYYSGPGAGGSILQVATKGIVGGAVSALKDETVNAFNSLLNGKKKSSTDGVKWSKLLSDENEKDREEYGKFEVDNGVIYALDDWGCISTDALMLGIKLDKSIRVDQKWYEYGSTYYKSNGKYYEKSPEKKGEVFYSDHLVWYDTTALITINSDKNMLISRVQGRDHSRKELISNGDIKFSVTGQITSGKPDVYPVNEIKKFIKVMQYKGIIKINNQILDQFGIKYIVITDFNISSKEGYKSVQNYTFSAIGLQPENEIEIKDDTVSFIEQKPMTYKDPDNKGWKDMLMNQLEGLKSMAGDIASQSAALATGMLDSKL